MQKKITKLIIVYSFYLQVFCYQNHSQNKMFLE